MSTGLAKTGRHRPVFRALVLAAPRAAQLLNQEHCNMPATPIAQSHGVFGAKRRRKAPPERRRPANAPKKRTGMWNIRQPSAWGPGATPSWLTGTSRRKKSADPQVQCTDTKVVTPSLGLLTTADSPCHRMRQASALSYSLNDRSEGNKPSRQSPPAGRSAPTVLHLAGSCVLHPKRSQSCPSR